MQAHFPEQQLVIYPVTETKISSTCRRVNLKRTPVWDTDAAITKGLAYFTPS